MKGRTAEFATVAARLESRPTKTSHRLDFSFLSPVPPPRTASGQEVDGLLDWGWDLVILARAVGSLAGVVAFVPEVDRG